MCVGFPRLLPMVAYFIELNLGLYHDPHMRTVSSSSNGSERLGGSHSISKRLTRVGCCRKTCKITFSTRLCVRRMPQANYISNRFRVTRMLLADPINIMLRVKRMLHVHANPISNRFQIRQHLKWTFLRIALLVQTKFLLAWMKIPRFRLT